LGGRFGGDAGAPFRVLAHRPRRDAQGIDPTPRSAILHDFMSAATQVGPLPRAAAPTPASSGWLFGAVPDLLLGCGLGYVVVIGFLCAFGPQVRDAIAPGVLPFVSVLIGAPHYGATLLRVYERREDRRAYALFAVHASLFLAAAFVVATRWLWLGSLLLTVYLTWSPWHYTGQNYGLSVMFLRRRGVALDAATKRWIYAAFVLSYAVVFIALHSHAPGAQYTPPLYTADGYRVLSLDLPPIPANVAFNAALAGYAIAMVVSAARLLRRASVRAVAPALALATTQALWFALPVAMRRYGLFANLEPFAPQYAGWYFFWAALAHSIQYVWVTSYFARGRADYPGLAPYLGKALFAGCAIWFVPALLFAPGALGRIPYDAGLAALIAAVVNLHHFVLDGAIWKLRDGRIARILVRSDPGGARDPATPAQRPSRAWMLLWAVGAAMLAIAVASFFETEFGLRRAYERADIARMRVALERLDWMGRESASKRLQFGQILAQRGDVTAAQREIRRSIELYPVAEAWIALADTYENTGRIRDARAALEQAVALSPNAAPLLYRTGSLANRDGDAERARALIERAAALDPDRKLYRVALDRLRTRAGELPPAADTAP
jgi:tetratricopeptide (TPR) repeat protein